MRMDISLVSSLEDSSSNHGNKLNIPGCLEKEIITQNVWCRWQKCPSWKQSIFKAVMVTWVSSVTPSPLAPKSTTLKTVSCAAGGDGGGGGRSSGGGGTVHPLPPPGVGIVGPWPPLRWTGLPLGLTGLVLGLGWYGLWFPLPFCLWELLLFGFPFLSIEVEVALLRLQCFPPLASHRRMLEHRTSKKRRSRKVRPFSPSLIFVFVTLYLSPVELLCICLYVFGR
jgi:hypothetical protein